MPIPGTTKLHRLEENVKAADLELTTEDLAEIESTASQITIQGARYPEAMERMEQSLTLTRRNTVTRIGGTFTVNLVDRRGMMTAENGEADERRGPLAEILEVTEREAIRRPREARAGAHHKCQPGAAAAALHRRRRRDCHDRTEDR